MQRILAAIAAGQNALARTRDTALFHVLTYGGLRRSEAAAMNWDHITQEGVFHVLALPETKSGVPQDVKLQPVVIHHLREYGTELELHGYSAQGAVFISLSRNRSHGARLTDQSINLIVKKYAALAGVPRNITAHMFRHTCCTLAIEGGAKPQQVQAHLRHKDLKTTMRYYEDRERLLDNASDYIKMG
jgi:integrase/recombinase XerD